MSSSDSLASSSSPEWLQWLAFTTVPPLALAAILGIPSAILYGAELAVTVCQAEFRHASFFRLFMLRCITSLVAYVASYMSGRFGRLGWFRDFYEQWLPPGLLAALYFLAYYTFHVENLATTAMLLNRLSSTVWPIAHEKMWRWGVPLAVGLTLLSPLPITVQSLQYQFYVRRQADNFSYTLDYHREPDVIYLNDAYLAAVAAVLFCCICAAINVATIIAYARSAGTIVGHQQHGTVDQEKGVELRLTLYAFITFLAQFLYAVMMIAIYITCCMGLNMDVAFLATINWAPLVTDACIVLAPAWLLLWASARMRRRVRQLMTVRAFATSPLEALQTHAANVAPGAATTTTHATRTVASADGNRTHAPVINAWT